MNNPYFLLDVAQNASDETIRAAYLAAIRNTPPERDPQRFSQIRTAFDAIATARARMEHQLFNTALTDKEDVLTTMQAAFSPPQLNGLRSVLGGKCG
jgi:curved DNA-binding protein CbpA